MSEIELKRFLAEKVIEGIRAFIEMLRKDKVLVSETKLYNQIEDAANEYVSRH
jgi:hypothetical protein